MFKLLNLFRPTETEVAAETMRARFERVTAELNDVLDQLDTLPAITVDAARKTVQIEAPEQFADEALALPKPEPKTDAKTDDADTQDDADAAQSDEKLNENKSDVAVEAAKSAA